MIFLCLNGLNDLFGKINETFCREHGCEFSLSEVWEKGGEGGIDLAKKVIQTIQTKENHFHLLYEIFH